MILSSEPTLLEPGASIHTYELWRMIFCAKEFQKILTYLEGNYVRLAKKYGEDKAAGKYMKRNGCGRKSFLRMRGRFEKMNLQPVPLRKNFREDVLEPPEATLLRLLEKSE